MPRGDWLLTYWCVVRQQCSSLVCFLCVVATAQLLVCILFVVWQQRSLLVCFPMCGVFSSLLPVSGVATVRVKQLASYVRWLQRSLLVCFPCVVWQQRSLLVYFPCVVWQQVFKHPSRSPPF